MSDFLFSFRSVKKGQLSSELAAIYRSETPRCTEYHGSWGSLAVTQSTYRGFNALETDTHIVVVIGGPVLCYQDNAFMSEDNSCSGTTAIYARWLSGKMEWAEDLSGPFVVLFINKLAKEVVCVTDLMMFIPVYRYENEDGIVISTHVDVLAKHCGQSNDLDEVSLIDFILHGVVTYPHTIYNHIFQCHPASLHKYTFTESDSAIHSVAPLPYWIPAEENGYKNIDEAARALQIGVKGYVERITRTMCRVAQFISAGEDSRVVTGLLPERLERHAFVFLDRMNREGKIAEKIAKVYGAAFAPDYRKLTYYLDILPEAADLVGAGHQYRHAHALGFSSKNKLNEYKAVFGGYLSDSLLKAHYARKPRGSGRFPFLPQMMLPGENRSKEVIEPLFPDEQLRKLTQRRRAHLRWVQSIRPSTAHEWFALWPMTMRLGIPNLYSNRRLFASFEPFMSKEVVKISAAVPVRWKLNRRLFNRAFRPYLYKSKWYFHPDGQLPYFPWWVNSPLRLCIWLYRQVISLAGCIKSNHGPWADWRRIQATSEWESAVNTALDSEKLVALQGALQRGALTGSKLQVNQKVNFFQVLYLVNKNKIENMKDGANTK